MNVQCTLYTLVYTVQSERINTKYLWLFICQVYFMNLIKKKYINITKEQSLCETFVIYRIHHELYKNIRGKNIMVNNLQLHNKIVQKNQVQMNIFYIKYILSRYIFLFHKLSDIWIEPEITNDIGQTAILLPNKE